MRNLSDEQITYRERFRPAYHFSAPYGWLNDPNGPIFYRGEYHLFYQYAPHSLSWEAPHWGHAVSADLLHWRHLPIALYPDEWGNIFSGTVVADRENRIFPEGEGLVAIFTHDRGGKEEDQSLAYSRDGGLSWQKYENNPVLSIGREVYHKDFRDPVVFWSGEEGRWVMLVGGGRYRVFSSADLRTWRLEAEWAQDEEFPDIFPLDGKWVLNLNGFGYYVGRFEHYRFYAEQPLMKEDCGTSWQACYHFADMPDGRQVLIGWMRDSGKGPTYPWRCNMSVPREARLEERSGRMLMLQQPVRELKALRRPLRDIRDRRLGEIELSELRGTSMDIELEFELPADGTEPLGIRLFKKGDRYAEISYSPSERMLAVDTRRAHAPEFDDENQMFLWKLEQNGDSVALMARRFSTYLDAGERLRLRILLDRSTLEVFANDGEAVFTLSVYPGEDADGMEFFGDKGIRLARGEFYRMVSVWNPD